MTDETKKPGRKGFGVNFKVSAKGAVSVYGLGRFPVTLYREQWVRLLERAGDLKAFMEEHADQLAKKGEAQPTSEQPAAESPAPEAQADGAVTPPAASAERPAEQTAEGAAPAATTVDDAGAADAPEHADADTPPDDYDGMS